MTEVAAQERAILEAALDSIIATDHESRVIEWNPAAERTFGYLKSAALGHDLADLIIPAELRKAHREGMKHFLATGEGPVLGKRIEVDAINSHGRRFPVELAIEAIEVSGKPRFVAYLRDLTERKAAEAALLESQQRLNATYQHAFVGISEVDLTGRFLRVNEELCRITGYTAEELLDRSFAQITHPDDVACDLESFGQQLEGSLGSYTLEKRYIARDGQEVYIELSASIVRDSTNRPLYGVRVVRDISDRNRAERQRALLVNELNHRVKNTLATVQSIVAQTLRNEPDPVQARKSIEGRLIMLSRAHDVLTRETWGNPKLHEIVNEAISAFQTSRDRINVDGTEVRLVPRQALALSMALHELATNATKHGALSVDQGTVSLHWELSKTTAGRKLHLRWREKNGPLVKKPTRRGFGSRLLEAGLARDLNGEVTVNYAADGLTCEIEFPLPLAGQATLNVETI